MTKSVHTVIGLMSGTSLDGLDIAACHFYKSDKQWHYSLSAAETIAYDAKNTAMLKEAYHADNDKIQEIDREYGYWLGWQVNNFIKKHQLAPDLISSHGHTVKHQPKAGITMQIGCGNAIANTCGITTINNFRLADVKKGGQGAPLVPVGDHLLFSDFDVCLNIGGIANLSYLENAKRRAFDICPANQVLNFLASKTGNNFDAEGKIAASGSINQALLQSLNKLEYYQQAFPKSLGREWVDEVFLPLIENTSIALNDQMCTVAEHIALQTALSVDHLPEGRMLVSGGGALNDFLMQRIQFHCRHKIVKANRELIDFKEAIVFALLGLLRVLDEINCYASVTGALSDSSTGDIHVPQT